MYGDLISEPASKRDSGYVDGGGEGGASLDVLNESASLLLPEDVAETDSSAAAAAAAAAGCRLSSAIRNRGGM